MSARGSSFSLPPLVRNLRKKDYKKLLAKEFREENERRRKESLQRKTKRKVQDPEVANTTESEKTESPTLPIKLKDRLPESKLRPPPVERVKDPSSERTILIDGIKKIVPVINPPKTSKSYKYNDMKRFKDEFRLKRFEYKLELGLATTNNSNKSDTNVDPVSGTSDGSNGTVTNQLTTRTESEISNEITVSTTPQDLLKNQRIWHEKVRAEREDHFNKLKETSEILSLTSNQPFISAGYKDRKREIGLSKYDAYQSMKRQDRLNHLISLYHSVSDFVTLNNLDAKIDEAFEKHQQVYTNTLDDMQMHYREMGGVSVEEIEKRLTQINDILEGTSRGRPGLDVIESPDSPIKSVEEEAKEDREAQSGRDSVE